MSTEQNAIQLSRVSENCVLLDFSKASFADDSFTNNPDIAIATRVASAAEFIRAAHASLVHDCVPAYTTLLIYFDIQHIRGEKFCSLLTSTLARWQRESIHQENNTSAARLVQIPVYYAEEVAQDLARLAQIKQLTIEELVRLHQQSIYTVYSIGFAPGFAYMGDVDARIAEPRLSTPRAQVARGSVGIAGKQTGIYPQSLPGGWNIIGRSPLTLFSIDEAGNPHCPYRMGDQVKFFAITREQFLAEGGEL